VPHVPHVNPQISSFRKKKNLFSDVEEVFRASHLQILMNKDLTGEWRRLHNEELYALYSSPNIIRVINSRKLRWAGHVARMEERRGA
jgi:hypothetical protein